MFHGYFFQAWIFGSVNTPMNGGSTERLAPRGIGWECNQINTYTDTEARITDGYDYCVFGDAHHVKCHVRFSLGFFRIFTCT